MTLVKFFLCKKTILSSLCLILLVSKCFKWSGWNSSLGGNLFHLFCISLVLWCICHWNFIKKTNNPVDKIIFALMLFPFFQIIPNVWMCSEPIRPQMDIFYETSVFLMYFVFKYYGLSEKDVLKLLLFISFLAFAIQIVQQLFPSKAVFGIYDEDRIIRKAAIAEIRNGFFRYKLGTYLFSILCFFFSLHKLMEKYSIKRIVVALALLMSVYLYLTRQLLVATVFTSLFMFLYSRNRSKVVLIVAIIISLVITFFFSNDLFADYIDSINADVFNEKYIRYLAANFFMKKILDNPVFFIFGQGPSSMEFLWRDLYGFHIVDIGIIGVWFHFGLCYVLLYAYQLYYFLIKRSNYIPMYLKAFYLTTVLCSIMIFPYCVPVLSVVWLFALYLSSLYLNGAKDYRVIYHRRRI